MYTVYAIYNEYAGKIYVGQTVDLAARLKLHKERTFKGYTSRFEGEWKLIHSEEVATRSEALSREKQLKSHQGRDFLRRSGVAQR